MTGGATNLTSFMQQVSVERTKTNNKLEKVMKKLDLLETQVSKEGGASEKNIEYLTQKTMVMDKQV